MAWTTEQVEALRWYARQVSNRSYVSGANLVQDGKYTHDQNDIPTRCRWCNAELWMHRQGAIVCLACDGERA